MNEEELKILISNTKSLKDIFKEQWLDEVLNNDSNKHPIKTLLKQDKSLIELSISELDKEITTCLKILDRDSNKINKMRNISGKLMDSDGFLNYLPEFEWIDYLSSLSKRVLIEPKYPMKGHDIEIDLGRKVAIEILSFLDPEHERRREMFTDEFLKTLRFIPSSFHVMINIKNEVSMNDVYFLKKIIKRKLIEFDKADVNEPSTFYYFSKNDIREWKNYNGLDLPDDINQNYEKYPLYLEGHTAKIEFILINTGEKHPFTFVGVGGNVTISKDDERLKEAIKDKIKQLPNDIPSVVIVNVLSPFLDSFSIQNAIFGQFQTNLLIENISGKIVREYNSRTANGIFNQSSRISSVVIYKKILDRNGIKFLRDVYRNPQAKNPISDEEAKLFGNAVN